MTFEELHNKLDLFLHWVRSARYQVVIVLVVLAAVVAVILWLVVPPDPAPPSASACGVRSQPSTTEQTVRGVVGSENLAFFNDPNVQAVFQNNGLCLEVSAMGSRQMAVPGALTGNDFAVPSSLPAAQAIAGAAGVQSAPIPLFDSPMVIATYKPVADVLRAKGIANLSPDGHWTFDVAKYLTDVFDPGLRWTQLPGPPGEQGVNQDKDALITTTDLDDSNSAEMFSTVFGDVEAGGQLSSPIDPAVVSELSRLFAANGDTYSSTGYLFTAYQSPQGESETPMAFVYEAQFVKALHDGSIAPNSDHVMMYPTLDVDPTRNLVELHPQSPLAARITQTIENNADALDRYAADDGFRPSMGASTGVFANAVAPLGPGIDVAVGDVTVIQPPAYPVMQSLLSAVENRLGYTVPSAAPNPSASASS